MSRHVAHFPSPLGTFALVEEDDLLTQIRWPEALPLPLSVAPPSRVLRRAIDELTRYFAGEPVRFTVPHRVKGTEFQREVWAALAQVPRGHPWTYRQMAQAIGRPTAMRAVGAALGANPLAILQPCHRVIGSQGHLTGFAGGLAAKQWLLDHEQPGVTQPSAR